MTLMLPGRRARRALLLSVLASGMLPPLAMPAHAIEEPDYQVERVLEGIELRRYSGYAVAEVVVPGPAAEAGRQAFPILAGYIFGKNKGEQKFEMTAPVTQSAAPGGYLVQFVLPKGVSAGNAPQPLDARVQLRDVAPTRVAVIRYSGAWTAANDGEHLAKLKTTLSAAGLAWSGEPVLSRYNGPLTPWFMRRNEIWLTLASAP